MFASKPASVKAPAGRARVVAVHADRRSILTGVFAGVALIADKASADVTPVDLFDDRAARKKGFDIIYEARDLDLPQNERDGIDQYRGDLTATKARFQDAKKRIEGPLNDYIGKQYWTPAKEELRNQVGNFRQDLRTLATSKGSKAERKEALVKAKDLLQACEELDLAIRDKNSLLATKLYANVKDKLSTFTSTVIA